MRPIDTRVIDQLPQAATPFLSVMIISYFFTDLPLSSNKCARHNGDCEQVCSLRGTYPDFTVACKCHLGYKLKENKRNCSGEQCDHVQYSVVHSQKSLNLSLCTADLNECDVVSHSCFPGECVNAQGSYYCACPNGYTNSSAQPSCNGTSIFAFSMSF